MATEKLKPDVSTTSHVFRNARAYVSPPGLREPRGLRQEGEPERQLVEQLASGRRVGQQLAFLRPVERGLQELEPGPRPACHQLEQQGPERQLEVAQACQQRERQEQGRRASELQPEEPRPGEQAWEQRGEPRRQAWIQRVRPAQLEPEPA